MSRTDPQVLQPPCSTPAPWSLAAPDVLRQLAVDSEQGLDDSEVARRRRTCGRNALETHTQRSPWSIVASQFRSIVVALLLIAAAFAFLFGEIAEGAAIAVVILINSAIGFVTELRAVRSMEALQEFARTDCVVVRGGTTRQIDAEDLVPGDIVLVEAGDLVPADLRLIEVAKLTANESTLTGESLPVRKHADALAADAALMDRRNLVFKGTSVTRGTARGVVVAISRDTEFGKIFTEVAAARPQRTPLEKRLDVLGTRLVRFIVVIAVIVALAGIAAGRELFLAIEVAIALSVAAIPEGLAIVATIALARGMWRMAARNALITRLSAVETLGATSVLLTDKTGTLTENRMAVSRLLLHEADVAVSDAHEIGTAAFSVDQRLPGPAVGAIVDELLRIGTLCSNAALDRGADAGVGDPTELALLTVASGRDIWRAEMTLEMPEIREDPFDPQSKRMATAHRSRGAILVAVKGAPEAILPCCTTVLGVDGEAPLTAGERQNWLERATRLGDAGLRTLALARKEARSEAEELYAGLTLVGVVGLEDPVREGVVQAIADCRGAGIEVAMLTGDHAATARHVAAATGILGAEGGESIDGAEVDSLFAAGQHDRLLRARVFSRVTPEQKLDLIGLYQQHGQVVAMTGDGVNDAPALKKADIGVAMGVRGTAVAKEAAEMILQDDELHTVVAAVAQGRAIFENIRKFVVYLLSCNTSEVLVISLATIAGAPLPLLPLQILFLNLVTDVFPALALGVGEGSPTLMRDRPRPATERIVTRRHWHMIMWHGLIIAGVVLVAMAVAMLYLDYEHQRAVSVAFCTLALAQMWHVFNMRGQVRRFVVNEITLNPWVWAALALCLALVLAAVYVPALSGVLDLADPGVRGWTLIVPLSLLPLAIAPIASTLLRRRQGPADERGRHASG